MSAHAANPRAGHSASHTAPRRPPRARPAAVPVAGSIALILIVIAVVAVRDLAVNEGWAVGTPWSQSLVDALDGLTPTIGLVIGGIVLAVVGLLLVFAALKPGRKIYLSAQTDADLWFSVHAVAALAQATADRVAGVISADASRANARRITVAVVTAADVSNVGQRVREALDVNVSGLTKATITVRTEELPR